MVLDLFRVNIIATTMKLVVLFLVAVSVANCSDYDRCKNDCYYYNFSRLLTVYRSSKVISRCISNLPKGNQAAEILKKINEDGSMMHKFGRLGKRCESTQFTLKDMRDCQADSIENIVKYAGSVLQSLEQLREDIKTDAPALNIQCVEMATEWPIRHFTEALDC